MKLSANDVASLGTILSIWAHPDDESFCVGGLLAMAAQKGQRVALVTATHGDAGKTADQARWPQEKLSSIREEELSHALQALGVSEHYWLDYTDGSLAAQNMDEAVEKLAAIIESVRPQTVFSFGPYGLTGHPDHQTIHVWTKAALERTDSAAVFYSAIELTELHDSPACQKCHQKFNIYLDDKRPPTIEKDEADLLFEIPADIQRLKRQSIEAHQSQMSDMLADPDGREYIEAVCCNEAFLKVEL